MKREIVIVCGVRPQFIKAAGFVYEISNSSLFHDVKFHIFNTGQHYSREVSQDIADDIGLTFDHTVQHSHGGSALTILMRSAVELERYFYTHQLRSPLVVVFGDANPALVGAIVAQKCCCPLVHIEAGARRDPCEQEHVNSRIVDIVAQLRLCVSVRAHKELRKENLDGLSIFVGDFAYRWMQEFMNRMGIYNSIYSGDYVLCSMHRKSNLNPETFGDLFDCLSSTNFRYILLTHPANEQLICSAQVPDNVTVVPAQPYSKTLKYIAGAKCVLTDSGGLAREAHLLGKSVLMRRDFGGWPELSQVGGLKNIQLNRETFYGELMWALDAVPIDIQASPLVVPGGIDVGLMEISKLI